MKKKKRKPQSSTPPPYGGLYQSQSVDLILGTVSANSVDIPWFLRLYAQVIRRAVVDYVLYYGHPTEKLGQIGDSAYEWLFKDNVDFIEVCSCLEVAPYAVREQTLGMSEEDARALRGLDFEDDPVGV